MSNSNRAVSVASTCMVTLPVVEADPPLSPATEMVNGWIELCMLAGWSATWNVKLNCTTLSLVF